MTIFDDLVEIARERHFGHETSNATERELCRVSKVPEAWCGGCRKGLHKHTYQPLPGSEPEDFELPAAEVVVAEVTPLEITPADATPELVKVSEIVTDLASRVLGVPRELIDASALDTEIVGIVEQPAQPHCACGTLLWFHSERSSGRCHKCSEIAALEQSLKDGVDEGRKP